MDPVAAVITAQVPEPVGPVAVLGDPTGDLTLVALRWGLETRVWNDDCRGVTPPALPVESLSAAVAGARTVLWRLPRAVSAVEEYAQLIAAGASQQVRVLAGARDKDLGRAMNTVLARSFVHVSASLGQRKARVLRASGPRPDVAVTWPRVRRLDRLGLTVVAHGATFNTNRLDRGTALLIEALGSAGILTTPTGSAPARRGQAADLGCGSGILATLLARDGWSAIATDISAAACASTRATAAANEVDVAVLQAPGLDGLARRSLDLIVTNPPFHRGTAKDSTTTRDWFAAAPDYLGADGELWVVFNSHLPYLRWLRDLVGPTEVRAQDRNYTVARCRPRVALTAPRPPFKA